MTIKQLLIGTLIGAGAVGYTVHHFTRKPVVHAAAAKQAVKVAKHRTSKSAIRLSQRPHRKQAAEAHLSLSKVFE